MALSGVRSSWLMVARKRLLAALARSDSARAISMRRSCALRSLTSRSTATTSRSRRPSSPAANRAAGSAFPTQMKWPAWSRVAFAADAEFERALFVQRGGVGERGEIGRPVGDMHAVEQAIAQQLVDRNAEQRLGRRRDKQHGAVAAMAHDDVGHVAGEQPVAVFLGVQHPEAGARERFGAERKAGGIKRRRDNAERGQHAMRSPRAPMAAAASRQARAPATIAAAASVKIDASTITRREADSAASSGTTTSQIAANEPMPPVQQRQRAGENRERERRENVRALVAAGARQISRRSGSAPPARRRRRPRARSARRAGRYRPGSSRARRNCRAGAAR